VLLAGAVRPADIGKHNNSESRQSDEKHELDDEQDERDQEITA
jgi:hypothetical protein